MGGFALLIPGSIAHVLWAAVGQGAGTSVPLAPAAGTSSAHCKYTWHSQKHCFGSGLELGSIGSLDIPDPDAESKNYSQNKKKQEFHGFKIGIFRIN